MARKLTTEEFISNAKQVHGEKYGYEKVEYINAITKVIIICPTHGEFEQSPFNHLQGKGCTKCRNEKVGNSKRKTLEEFLSRSKSVWGENTFDYSKTKYRKAVIKVTIICKKHGIEFKQLPTSHLQGCISCPQCLLDIKGRYNSDYWAYERCYNTAKKYEWLSDFMKENLSCYRASHKKDYLKDFTWLKRNYEKDENIITSKKHCIYKYEFPQFNTVYIGLTVNLRKRYKTGHSKKGPVYNFCKYNNIEVSQPQIVEENLTLDEAKVREDYWIRYYKEQGHSLLNKAKAGSVGLLCKVKTGKETEQFIEKSKVVHGGKYNYSKVEYVNCDTKVIITCPKHGDFTQTPRNHLHGHGCQKCSGVNKPTTEEFIKRARSVHGDKYGYGKVEYKNATTKVIIICPIHGDFLHAASSHLQGSGCPKCANERRVKLKTKWTYETCKVESTKYKSRFEFQKGSYGAYLASWKNKWLDEFFPKK